MKAIGKEILRSKGFVDKEIFLEFPVLLAGQIFESGMYGEDPLESGMRCEDPIKLTVRRGIIADVIGLKKEKSIVIECGNTPSDRLSQLKLFFDEVLYLPYVKTMGRPEKDLLELNSQITALTNQNTELQRKNEWYEQRLEKIEAKIKEALRG